MKVVYVSVVSVEDIPVYHACPGHLALRVVLPGSIVDCEWCWWSQYASEKAIVTRGYERSVVEYKARVLGTSLVFFDGGEPLLHEWILGEAEELKKRLEERIGEAYTGVKTTGLVGPRVVREAVKVFDLVVLEYHASVKPSILARRVFLENLKMIAEESIVFEIHLFLDGSRRAEIAASELAHQYASRAALHLIPISGDPFLEDRAYKLASKLRRKKLNVYLYGDESYTAVDTLCPKCGSVLVSRKPWGVDVKGRVREDSRVVCPSCGTEHSWLIACKKPRKHSVHREIVVY